MSNSTTTTRNPFALGRSVGESVRSLITSLRDHHRSHSLPSSPSELLVALRDLWRLIRSLPRSYGSWWMNLLEEDPVHVFVETVLVTFVVYMIVMKQIDGRRRKTSAGEGQLSESEKEELIREWRPEPLVPPSSSRRRRQGEDEVVGGGAGEIVVHRIEGTRMVISDGRDRHRRIEEDDDDRRPMENGGGSGRDSSSSNDDPPTTRTVLNMATHDFLGMGSSSPAVRDASRATLARYGCGSCGPRGFYGTVDVHLDLEDRVAEFCGTDGAIMYSDGASAASSTVAAFAKRGDLLVVDEGIHEALQTGVTLSRANVKFFKHNDMDDLRRVLTRIRESDAKIGRRPSDVRRFIIVEGLYRNYGHVCPVDELVNLKDEFSYRLIVDESYSFGTMGKRGMGAIELAGRRMMVDVEIVVISLENSLGSVGGVCVGNEEVVDHQRLSGAGYCFSASAPPFVAGAAIASLSELRDRGRELMARLAENREAMYRGLRDVPRLRVTSDELSPIAFVRLAPGWHKVAAGGSGRGGGTIRDGEGDEDGDGGGGTGSKEEDEEDRERRVLDEIVRRCLDAGVAVASTSHVRGFLHLPPPPSFRMTVTAAHTLDDVETAIRTLKDVVSEVLPP